MVKNAIGRQQLRSFGLVLAGGFAVIALTPLALRSHNPRTWALGLALVLAASAVIFPLHLRPLYRVWMTIGEGLGWLNTRIILAVVYYGLMVPAGIILRMAGKDLMRLKLDRDAESYRIPRAKRSASHLQRQY